MRVAIDLTSLADNFSGIERYAMSMAKELINDDAIDFILVFKNEVHNEFKNTSKNIEKIILNGGSKLLFNQFILPHALRKIKADVYLFLAFPAPFFFSNGKTISAIHDVSCWDCPGSNKNYMIWYFKLMYWKATRNKKRIITVSEFSKGRIKEVLGVRDEDIIVAYDGLSNTFKDFVYDASIDKQVRHKYDLPTKFLLCLATMEPRKNLSLLINAYTELINEDKIDIDLVLAGRKGWLVDDMLKSIPEKVVSKIHFTGFVDENDLPYIYSDAKIFVFPSLYEGFGVPPIEAMSMGTLVISSDAASLPEACGNSAYYFKSDNTKSLKDNILEVFSLSKEDAEKRIEAGKRQAQTFNWSVEAHKIMNILGE